MQSKEDKKMSVDNSEQIKDMEREEGVENLAEEKVESSENQEGEEVVVDEIEEIKKELEAAKDQRMRLFADFENFKKRTAKERLELFGTANQELMSALLPVLDDFNRALKNLEEGEAKKGVELIYSKLENTLKQKGLKPMPSTIGKTFDVETMEAVTRIPAPEPNQKGKVIDEIEQGFELGNKIIRYAKVVVGE